VAVAAARLLRGRHYPTTFADFHSWFWSRGLLFHRLIEQAGITTPKPAKGIIGGKP
jgi:hypothetical protein